MGRLVSGGLRDNRNIILAAVSQKGWALQYASAGCRGDRDIVLAAVTQNGCALEFAASNLKADNAVVQAAVAQYPDAAKWASRHPIAQLFSGLSPKGLLRCLPCKDR